MISARVGVACVSLLVAIGVAPGVARAQARLVDGRVTRATDKGPVPVSGQWVVLHRVGSDRSAPLDSVRTDRAGKYRIRYSLSGDPDALYFVSARYSGIAYFSSPLRAPTVRGDDAAVIVYATTPDTTGLSVQGRHLVVSAPRGVRREVAEVFEIENSGFRTIVARDSVSPVWSMALPERAESASVAPSDVSMAAVTFRGGRAEVYAPISPGVRQVVFTYQVPATAFPLSFRIGRPVTVLEVLLEEPRAVVTGARLAEVAPAAIERRMFRRFLAQDVPATAVMRVSAPPPVEQNQSNIRLLSFATAAALVAAIGVWALRRRKRTPILHTPGLAGGEGSLSTADVMIAELATLDARLAETEATAQQRAANERHRAQLKARIASALAAENRSA